MNRFIRDVNGWIELTPEKYYLMVDKSIYNRPHPWATVYDAVGGNKTGEVLMRGSKWGLMIKYLEKPQYIKLIPFAERLMGIVRRKAIGLSHKVVEIPFNGIPDVYPQSIHEWATVVVGRHFIGTHRSTLSALERSIRYGYGPDGLNNAIGLVASSAGVIYVYPEMEGYNPALNKLQEAHYNSLQECTINERFNV